MKLVRFFTATIRGKILLSFILVIFLVLILAVATFTQLRRVRNLSLKITPNSLRLAALQDYELAIAELESNLDRFSTIGGGQYQQAIDEDFTQLYASLDAFEPNISPDMVPIYNDLVQETQQLEAEISNLLAVSPSELSSRESNERGISIYSKLDVVKAQRKTLAEMTSAELNSLAVNQEMLIANIVLQTIIFWGIVLGLVGVTSLLVTRSITRSLAVLTEAASQIEQGNLDVEIPVTSQDEIGQLAQTFNSMAVQLRESIDSLKAYTVELERSNRELEEFAYVASHDLQEPLRKILAFGNRLQLKYADVLDDRGYDYLERMQKAAARMQQLIVDLLAFSRVTSKAPSFKPVNLNDVICSVLVDMEMTIKQAQGEVLVEMLPEIDAEETQMRQLFQNLISNGLKFKKPDVPPVVRISSKRVHGKVERCQISVSDNGIGFDQQHTERIFNVFQRLHNRTEYPGTGVGLAVCRKIVEHHSGSIEAVGVPQEGATFVITLPLKQETTAID